MEELNQITEKIIGCAIAVHRELGPGLLESLYEAALAIELEEAGVRVIPFGPLSLRAVLHLEINDEDLDLAIAAFGRVLGDNG